MRGENRARCFSRTNTDKASRLLSPAGEWAAVAAFIACVALLAAHYGWLNDDALNYIVMAGHMAQGHWPSIRPSWGDTYWAVFPGGYPAVIAALSRLLAGDALPVSKLANGLLLLGSIVMAARWLALPPLLAASLFTTAAWLEIVSYSWSENLFFFASLLSLMSLCRYIERGGTGWLGTYALGLILLFTSRYIGGFLLPAFMAVAVLFRRRSPHARLVAIIAVTAGAGVLFGAYLYTNLLLTGYPTGMARRPATESFTELLGQFIAQIAAGAWALLPPLVIWMLAGGRIKALGRLPFTAMPPLLFGLAYLALLFALRSASSFEQFSPRLLLPGLFFIWLALLHALWQGRALPRMALAVFFSAALVNLGITYRDFFIYPGLVTNESAARAMQRFDAKYGALKDGTVILSAGYDNPMMGWKFISPVFSYDRVFYIVADNYPFSLADYRAYLAGLWYKGAPAAAYSFDFTEFKAIDELEHIIERRQLDPALAEWIKSHFHPGAFVPCPECRQYE